MALWKREGEIRTPCSHYTSFSLQTTRHMKKLLWEYETIHTDMCSECEIRLCVRHLCPDGLFLKYCGYYSTRHTGLLSYDHTDKLITRWGSFILMIIRQQALEPKGDLYELQQRESVASRHENVNHFITETHEDATRSLQKEELQSLVIIVWLTLQNTFVRYNRLMTLGCNQCKS